MKGRHNGERIVGVHGVVSKPYLSETSYVKP